MVLVINGIIFIINKNINKKEPSPKEDGSQIYLSLNQGLRAIFNNFRNKQLSVYGFASDQSPKPSAAHHWAPFMGHVVPVHTGAEMLAKRFDMNVIFLRTKKVKRGFYVASFEVLSEDAKSVPDYEITGKFLKLVGNQN